VNTHEYGPVSGRHRELVYEVARERGIAWVSIGHHLARAAAELPLQSPPVRRGQRCFVVLMDDDEPPGAHRVSLVTPDRDAAREALTWLTARGLPTCSGTFGAGEGEPWALFRTTTLDEFRRQVSEYLELPL
jgi:hypothetical protein